MTESRTRTEDAGRPRLVVSVVATVDGRVALSRAERLLDGDPGRRWRAAWPEDSAELTPGPDRMTTVRPAHAYPR